VFIVKFYTFEVSQKAQKGLFAHKYECVFAYQGMRSHLRSQVVKLLWTPEIVEDMMGKNSKVFK